MPQPRTVSNQRRLLAAGAVFVLVSLTYVWLAWSEVPDPPFEGRRVSAWFRDLSTGVFGGSAVALRQMESRAEPAIPALLEAWKHDHSAVRLNGVTALAAAPSAALSTEGLFAAYTVLAE
jgi:hypothetical protein